MRAFFNHDQEREFGRLQVFKETIADQNLVEKPCPLLTAQLNALEVIAEKMLASIRKLQATIET